MSCGLQCTVVFFHYLGWCLIALHRYVGLKLLCWAQADVLGSSRCDRLELLSLQSSPLRIEEPLLLGNPTTQSSPVTHTLPDTRLPTATLLQWVGSSVPPQFRSKRPTILFLFHRCITRIYYPITITRRNNYHIKLSLMFVFYKKVVWHWVV